MEDVNRSRVQEFKSSEGYGLQDIIIGTGCHIGEKPPAGWDGGKTGVVLPSVPNARDGEVDGVGY